MWNRILDNSIIGLKGEKFESNLSGKKKDVGYVAAWLIIYPSLYSIELFESMEDGSKSINDREPKLGTKEHAEWVSKYLKPTNNKRISKPVEQVFKGSASGKQIQSADSSQSSKTKIKS